MRAFLCAVTYQSGEALGRQGASLGIWLLQSALAAPDS